MEISCTVAVFFVLALGSCMTGGRVQADPEQPEQADPEESASPPNVLLLMADQFRGDALGCAGNPAARTPHLDRLAREGCFFPRAYSSTPSCTPARAALLTGASPWGHGMLGYSRIKARYPVELPRLFSDAGYRTHAIGKNHFDPQRHRHGYQTVELDESGRVESEDFVSDYRRWFSQRAPELDCDATGIGWNDYRAAPYALPEELHPTRWTGDRAVSFLEQVEGPFFLKVSFARPHSPYDPPMRLWDEFAEADVPEPFVGAWSEEAQGSIRRPEAHTAARNHLDAEATLRSRRAYYANVKFVDEQIGRVVASLRERELLENTLIVFVSDHGDMLGDHHLWRKTYAYEGSARIPFIVRWGAQVFDGPRGQVRDEVVELRDILPTLCDAAGLSIPAEVEGRSVLGLARGDETTWRPWLDLEHATTYWPRNAWNALTDGRFKYIYFALDGEEQLFDLRSDPGETRDLVGSQKHAAELELWRGRLVRHLSPRGIPWVVEGRLGIREATVLHGPAYGFP